MTFASPWGCLLLTALAVQGGCSSKLCSEVGCLNGAQLTRPLAVSDAQALALVVTVCRNQACSTGTRASGQENPSSIVFSFTGSVQVFGYVDQTGSGGRELQLQIDDSESETENLHDGDVYAVKVIVPGSKTALLDVTSTATYTTSQPNGPACEPTCKSTTL